MTKEEALSKVKGYLTDYLPSEDYKEIEEIVKALDQELKTNGSYHPVISGKAQNPPKVKSAERW